MQTSEQNKDQSATHKNSSANAKLLEIKRDFSVPLEQLFKAFTNSEALKIWWWPKGLHADRVDYDFREGGHYFINMKGFDQGGGGMTGYFEEILPNERIVMTDQFADENGSPISAQEAKMPGDWPTFSYITFEFEEMSENASRLRLSQQGIPNEIQKDCLQGWNQQFDKLEQFLEGSKNS